jgi:hypothetical protein
MVQGPGLDPLKLHVLQLCLMSTLVRLEERVALHPYVVLLPLLRVSLRKVS